MTKKQKIIIFGAIGLVLTLLWFFFLLLMINNWRAENKTQSPTPAAEVTLCDADRSDLCIIAFGANALNRMVIHFQLPAAGYDLFYVKAQNREAVSVYTCEVDEELLRADCTGVRTPLGETIEVQIYRTDDDTLMAQGTFMVSAIAIPTPVNQMEETSATELPAEGTPEEEFTPTP